MFLTVSFLWIHMPSQWVLFLFVYGGSYRRHPSFAFPYSWNCIHFLGPSTYANIPQRIHLHFSQKQSAHCTAQRKQTCLWIYVENAGHDSDAAGALLKRIAGRNVARIHYHASKSRKQSKRKFLVLERREACFFCQCCEYSVAGTGPGRARARRGRIICNTTRGWSRARIHSGSTFFEIFSKTGPFVRATSSSPFSILTFYTWSRSQKYPRNVAVHDDCTR